MFTVERPGLAIWRLSVTTFQGSSIWEKVGVMSKVFRSSRYNIFSIVAIELLYRHMTWTINAQ